MYSDALIRQILDLNDRGLNASQIATEVGKNTTSMVTALHRRGIRLKTHKRAPHNKAQIDENLVCSLYAKGSSVLGLARDFNVSRNAIVRVLKENGVKIRGSSEANVVSMSQMPKSQILQRVSAAHEAVRGAERSHDELTLRARTKSKTKSITHGKGELEVAALLHSHGFQLATQHAVDIYNIDVLVNNAIAVEVTGLSVTRYITEDGAHRLEKIRESGLGFVSIHFRDVKAILVNANHLISDLKAIYGDPASIREQWVVRCSYDTISASCSNPDQASPIDPSIEPTYARYHIRDVVP